MRKLLSPEKQETEMKCYIRPPVAQKMSDNPIQWIKLYQRDCAIGFPNTCNVW